MALALQIEIHARQTCLRSLHIIFGPYIFLLRSVTAFENLYHLQREIDYILLCFVSRGLSLKTFQIKVAQITNLVFNVRSVCVFFAEPFLRGGEAVLLEVSAKYLRTYGPKCT
jgi:hypothetical protein